MAGTPSPRRPGWHTAFTQLGLIAIAVVGNVWAMLDVAYHAEGELEGRLVPMVIWGVVALPAMVALLVMSFRANWPLTLLGMALLSYLAWTAPFVGVAVILLAPWVPWHPGTSRPSGTPRHGQPTTA